MSANFCTADTKDNYLLTAFKTDKHKKSRGNTAWRQTAGRKEDGGEKQTLMEEGRVKKSRKVKEEEETETLSPLVQVAKMSTAIHSDIQKYI